jgi:molybdopterin synthase catalytic subunit/molybdopterin converting factor small subunit
MDLTVRLFAALRERAGASEIVLRDLPEDLDLAGLKRALERAHPEVGRLAHVAGAVGTEYVRDAHRLKPGDEVSLLPPVSGGAPSRGETARDADSSLEGGIFELSADALDPAHCEDRVRHPSCGAIVTFTGTTRDSNRGQRVVELEYEAFEAMTGPEMARIFARCRAELEADDRERALRMLCRHRVGVVRVGEPSVVIAVASPHRDVSFRACRFLIDELKATLPVWKKEIYAEGHFWIGDRS